MAIAFANLGVNAHPDLSDPGNGSIYTNGPTTWTPPTSGLILVFIYGRVNTTSCVITGNNLTWVQISEVTFGSSNRLWLFGADAAGSTTDFNDFDFTPGFSSNCIVSFFHATGVDLTGGVLNAFVETVGDSGSGTSATINLTADPGTDDRSISGIVHEVLETKTPGTLWAEQDNFTVASPDRSLCSQSRADIYDPVATASWATSSTWYGLASRLLAAPTGAIPVSQDMIAAWESQTGLSVPVAPAWESEASLAVPTVAGYESLGGVVVPYVGPYEAQQGLVVSRASPYESLAGLSVNRVASWESLSAALGVSQQFLAVWESGGRLTVPFLGSWESAAPVLAALVGSYESLQTALQTVIAPWETQQGLIVPQTASWESLGTIPAVQQFLAAWEAAGVIRVPLMADYEALQGVFAQLQSGYEALQGLDAAVLASWEAAGLITAQQIAAWEAAGFAVADIIRLLNLAMHAGRLAPVTLDAGHLDTITLD